MHTNVFIDSLFSPREIGSGSVHMVLVECTPSNMVPVECTPVSISTSFRCYLFRILEEVKDGEPAPPRMTPRGTQGAELDRITFVGKHWMQISCPLPD